jgi:hypothetical protein
VGRKFCHSTKCLILYHIVLCTWCCFTNYFRRLYIYIYIYIYIINSRICFLKFSFRGLMSRANRGDSSLKCFNWGTQNNRLWQPVPVKYQRRGNDSYFCWVLQGEIMKDKECICRDCLKGGLSLWLSQGWLKSALFCNSYFFVC